MKMTRTNPPAQKTPAQAARLALDEQRAKLARFEADIAAAEAELDSLTERAGGEVLDDPDAAAGLARSMRELRDLIEITGRAVEAQRPRVRAAEVAYLEAEATLLSAEAEKSRAALARHQQRTAELLEQLRQHEGAFVPEHHLIQSQRDSNVVGVPDEWDTPKSEMLEDALARAELPVTVLREMAADRDPQPIVNDAVRDHVVPAIRAAYPACVWGPGAVVPAPAYQREVARAREHLQRLEAEARRLPEELADWEQQQAASPNKLDGLRSRRRRAEVLPAQLEQARQTWAELTQPT